MRKYLKSDGTHYKFLHTTDPGAGRYFTEKDYQTFLKEWEDIMNNTFYVPRYDYFTFIKNKGFTMKKKPSFNSEIGGTDNIEQMGVTSYNKKSPYVPTGVSVRYPDNY